MIDVGRAIGVGRGRIGGAANDPIVERAATHRTIQKKPAENSAGFFYLFSSSTA